MCEPDAARVERAVGYGGLARGEEVELVDGGPRSARFSSTGDMAK